MDFPNRLASTVANLDILGDYYTSDTSYNWDLVGLAQVHDGPRTGRITRR